MLIRRKPYIGHQLVVSAQAFDDILCYTTLWPKEVAGYGLIRRDGMTFYLDEVFILDQVVSGYHTTVSPKALHRKIGELTQQNRRDQLRFHWHSHVNFEAYFSATDVANIHGWGGEWLVSLVLNKRGDIEVRLDEFCHGRHHIWHVRLLLAQDHRSHAERVRSILHVNDELDQRVRVGNPILNTGGHLLSLLRRRLM